MTTRAEITPYFTNHSLRATTVTVLSERNVETRQIKAVTGHRMDTSIENYCERPTLCEAQTYFSLRKIFRGERSDDRKNVCASQAINPQAVKKYVNGSLKLRAWWRVSWNRCACNLPSSSSSKWPTECCFSFLSICSNATKLSGATITKFPRWKWREPRCHSALWKLPELLLHF